jgi:hypothetical protein
MTSTFMTFRKNGSVYVSIISLETGYSAEICTYTELTKNVNFIQRMEKQTFVTAWKLHYKFLRTGRPVLPIRHYRHCA